MLLAGQTDRCTNSYPSTINQPSEPPPAASNYHGAIHLLAATSLDATRPVSSICRDETTSASKVIQFGLNSRQSGPITAIQHLVRHPHRV